MVVVLLGPPGVGKGAQGEFLAEALGWERLVTGDLLRATRRQGTELGKKATAYMDAGDLVPDELIVALVKERLQGIPPDRGVLFDGFPRTVPQAEALSAALAGAGWNVDGVLVLEAPDDVLVKRIVGRRICPKCLQVYNIHFDPPRVEDLCDTCGGRLDHREDDTPETAGHRHEVYRELTEPLIAYYEGGAAPVLRVDGNRPLEVVREAVWQTLVEELEVG